jgi:hypothetical protein
LLYYIFTPLFVGAEICLEEIREEEKLQDSEHYEKLQQDNDPERTPPGHTSKAIVIEPEDPSYYHIRIR